MRVSDEFLEMQPMANGSATGTIDTAFSESVTLSLSPKNTSGSALPATLPYLLDIYDDVDGALIASGVVISSNSYTIPVDYTKRIGVYKFVARDATGRMGTTTLAVRSGPFDSITILPVSSAILHGTSTFGFVRLTDRLGNLLSPEFHTMRIETTGGYMLDTDGSQKTVIERDTMESESMIAFGSDTPGQMKLVVTIDGIKTQSLSIRILESAKLQLERVGGVPQVGGAGVPVRIRVLDNQNQQINGFSSVAHLQLPENAGSFSVDAVRIEDGISDYFTFTPGRLAGDHALSITVPGIGTVPDIIFSVRPGIPLSIAHSITDQQVNWKLLDRYGNATRANMTGSIVRNADAPESIAFSDGVYSMIRNAGFYTVNVP